MLDLSTIKTQLETLATGLAQVVLPDLEDTQSIDSASVLVPILDANLAGNSHPILLPETITYPAAVYRLADSDRVDVDGYPIVRTDQYDVAILHGTGEDARYSTAVTAAATVRAALQDYSPTGDAGSIEILSQGDDYNDELQIFEIGLLAQITHLARTSQDLPAAFLYTTGETFEAGDSITCITGMAESRFSVLLVAKMPATGVSGLSTIRNQILNALAAYEPSGWSMIQPEGGRVVTVHSKLVLWRDEFSTVQERTYS